MVGRIVELNRTGLAVHKRRGFLAVDEDGAEAGRIGLDESRPCSPRVRGSCGQTPLWPN